MRVNREIRAPRVRVISPTGEQIGIITLNEALAKAEEFGLDLVEISPNSVPPVCKIVNFGKFRYEQTKRERESKKAQHQIKVKEIKLKPNIDTHDFETKMRHARSFLERGDKVKIACFFRGREMAHVEIGEKVVQQMCEALTDIATVETPMKLFGKSLTAVVAPDAKKKASKPKKGADEAISQTVLPVSPAVSG